MALANIFVFWRSFLKTKTKNVFKTSSRRLYQDECLLGCNIKEWFYLASLAFRKIQVKRQSFADALQNSCFKTFTDFTGKHLCWNLFLINLLSWWAATLLKRDSNTNVFVWNLQNFKTLFFTEHLQCLLLLRKRDDFFSSDSVKFVTSMVNPLSPSVVTNGP